MKAERVQITPSGPASLRIDKLLFFLRFARSRSLAQALAAAGHIRVAGRRIERASHPVAIGDVVTLPLGTGVVVFELLALPLRRGPAEEARACYRPIGTEPPNVPGPLDDVGAFAIAAPITTDQATGAMGTPQQ